MKTKGSISVDGKVINGKPLQGASVSVSGLNTVVSGQDGTFSFLLLNELFSINSVSKNGYSLVDSDILSKRYHFSSNPLIIVMEKPSRQAEELLRIERGIRRTLQQQLQEKEAEIEALREQNAITADEYNERMRTLYIDTGSNESLISQMAKRYAMIDFDQLDEFNSQVSAFIINGELTKADSLLKTKGDIFDRIETLNRHKTANAYTRTQLEKSELLAQKEMEDIGQDCYRRHEILKMQLQLDSSAFFLEMRAALDTTNTDWQKEAGEFIYEFIGDYPKALTYFERCMRIHKEQGENGQAALAEDCSNIGGMYYRMHDYCNAIKFGRESFRLNKLALGEANSKTAEALVNLFMAIYSSAERDEEFVEEYPAYSAFSKADEICKNNPNVDLDILAYINDVFGQVMAVERYYDRAMIGGFLPALEIRREKYGEDSFEVASSYRMIGLLYSRQSHYFMSHWWDDCNYALEYFRKALPFYEEKYGELHPDVGTIYWKMGDACLLYARNSYETGSGQDLPEYIKGAVDYHQKAINSYTEYYKKTGIRHPNMDSAEKGVEETQELIRHINAEYDALFPSRNE